MFTVMCDRRGCGNRHSRMDRERPPEYYFVEHRDGVNTFCSARCAITVIEGFIPHDNAVAALRAYGER